MNAAKFFGFIESCVEIMPTGKWVVSDAVKFLEYIADSKEMSPGVWSIRPGVWLLTRDAAVSGTWNITNERDLTVAPFWLFYDGEEPKGLQF